MEKKMELLQGLGLVFVRPYHGGQVLMAPTSVKLLRRQMGIKGNTV